MLKVKATHTGYYDHKRRREGEEFAMSEKDYYRFDDKGEKETEIDADGDKVYKTASWVELISENYDPSEVPKVEKKNVVKNLVQSVSPVEPKSANPAGFAPSAAPAKAVSAKKDEKPLPGTPTFATHSSQGDDVI